MGRQILTTTYDALHNPLTIKDALDRTTTNQYDNLSRLIQVTDPLGRNTQFGYDDLDRLVSTIDALNGISGQTFDADGNLNTLADPNNNTTDFDYDTTGRLSQITFASGSIKTMGYNSRNLLSQLTNGRGQITNYEYDDAGRLLSFTDPTGTVSYTYDNNGNVLTSSDSNGTITCEYDALNRLVKYTDTQGNIIQYAYDAAGNLVTLTYPGDKQVQYEYDDSNRLIHVTDWASRVTTYEYDANDRMVRTVRPNGTVLTRSYDAAGQILQQKDVDQNNNIICQYDYTYDAAGNVKTEQASPAIQPFTLQNAEITYTSDNRIATFNGQSVDYDADGNMTTGPVNGQMGSYAYDARGRLTGAGDLNYAYDAVNNRISVADSVYQTQTRYVINPNAALSQVLIKTDAQNNQTFYVYGLELIGQEETGGAYRTYHYDRRGNTVALTDENGNATDIFQYSPYGTLVYRSGNTSTPFQYDGRDGVITDDNGLHYMRARYYSSSVSSFVSADKYFGQINNGLTLNRYLYCGDNPVIYIDPFGNAWYDSKMSDITGITWHSEKVINVSTGVSIAGEAAQTYGLVAGVTGVGLPAAAAAELGGTIADFGGTVGRFVNNDLTIKEAAINIVPGLGFRQARQLAKTAETVNNIKAAELVYNKIKLTYEVPKAITGWLSESQSEPYK